MNSNWSYSPETPNLGQIRRFLEPWDLAIWRMTLKNNRAPLLCYFKHCASFHSHWWIQTGVTVRKRPIWVKFDDFFTSVTLTLDLWPWLFAWTSLLSLVITPENVVMIQWWEHSQKGVTDRQTDGLNHSYSCLVAAKNSNHWCRASETLRNLTRRLMRYWIYNLAHIKHSYFLWPWYQMHDMIYCMHAQTS